MKKIYLLLLLQSLIFNLPSFGQSEPRYRTGGGTWTWISGDSAQGSSGVFGTKGVPSVNNHPPGIYEPCEWKDKQGNLWVYGGTYPAYSDLWKYNPITNEWTWVMGKGVQGQSPVYGTKGVPDSLNTPGARYYCAATWVDTSGALWLFGGQYGIANRNDLWKYTISANEWTWMNGSDVTDAKGIHGTQGMPGASNTPGARGETCSAWTDSLNNLWLFGGYGYDDNDAFGNLNDLCKYNVSTNEWTWMKGSPYVNAPVKYGTKGVTNATNDPGARWTYNKWKDLQGNFWLMGGTYNANPGVTKNSYNDMWKYDLSINEWTWMSGTNVANDSGKYMINCVFDTVNRPRARFEQRSSVTDNCGRFWLLGGINEGGTNYAIFNDLWVFDPQQLKWNWLNGTNVPNQYGNYGNKGVASPSNLPPSRFGADAWWGTDNKFYMFGGQLNCCTHCFSDVWEFNPDTACVPVCGQVVLYPNSNFLASDTSICANDCINFRNLSANAVSWQWSFPGAIDSTSTATTPQNICYASPGIYNVTLIASNNSGSDSVSFVNYINVKAAPPAPVITQKHDTLFIKTDTSYSSYQWFADTNLIAGATDTFLVVSKNGNYNVQVTNENGCKTATGINIVLGVQNYANNNILSIFPNPAMDELSITGNGTSETGKAMLTIFNVFGETIYTKELNHKQEMISCKPFPPGIYFVQVVRVSGSWTGRFVKE